MKVAVVGGGGFRTPLLLGALAGVPGIEEIALHDVSDDRLARIRAVMRALHRDAPAPFRTTWSTDLVAVVDGASAVLAAIRPGGLEARIVDESVPHSHGVLGQETVGPGGVCFALRTVPAMRSIAATVAERAPDAWLVNFTNPAGTVTESVRDLLGDRAVGICDSPAGLCARAAAALGRPPSSLSFDYAGLNHLGWLVGIEDETGHDLLPGLLADDGCLGRIEEVAAFGYDHVRSLGAIPNEYLLYLERADRIVKKVAETGESRGTVVASQQRGFFDVPIGTDEEMRAAWRSALDRRNITYMAEARPRADDPARRDGDGPGLSEALPGEEGYAAVAADFLRAVTSDEPRTLIVDAANGSRLPGIGRDEVVEASCRVGSDGVRPTRGRRLPARAQALVERIKEVERLTMRAAITGSSALALEALAAHPLMPSRDVAEAILADYLGRQPALRRVLR